MDDEVHLKHHWLMQCLAAIAYRFRSNKRFVAHSIVDDILVNTVVPRYGPALTHISSTFHFACEVKLPGQVLQRWYLFRPLKGLVIHRREVRTYRIFRSDWAIQVHPGSLLSRVTFCVLSHHINEADIQEVYLVLHLWQQPHSQFHASWVPWIGK